jgi:DNA-3-methyladenine glycosylase I
MSKPLEQTPKRCAWCSDDPLYIEYHDTEWGVPTIDSLALFEMLNLEGAQAGLSWITVLKKRAHYRKVFDGFDPVKMAQYDEEKIAQLLNDPGIIRNRLKVNAFVNNAKRYLEMQESLPKEGFKDFSEYLWSFVGGKPIVNNPKSLSDIPTATAQSDAMSKDLKKRGFKFVGSTICYAFMQACGMVNDHEQSCFRYHGALGSADAQESLASLKFS